jgi:hypothetical protein
VLGTVRAAPRFGKILAFGSGVAVGASLAGFSSSVGSSGTAFGRGGETDAGVAESSSRGTEGASSGGADESKLDDDEEDDDGEVDSNGPKVVPVPNEAPGAGVIVDPQFPLGQSLGIRTGRLTRTRGEAKTGRIEVRRWLQPRAAEAAMATARNKTPRRGRRANEAGGCRTIGRSPYQGSGNPLGDTPEAICQLKQAGCRTVMEPF